MAGTDEFDDIPGTVVFTGRQARKGYHLNQFCMSLMTAENRQRFQADQSAYLDEWPLTAAQRQAVLDRDYNAAIAEGGNIYFLSKIIFADGQSMQHAAGLMTGMSTDDYRAMMAAGGRRPDGWRSVKEGS
jgi:protocatechuate 4,5-dioxygenase alpha chain